MVQHGFGAFEVPEIPESAVCRFYRLIPGAPEPRRAERSACGTVPADALRYCEPLTTASAFGWYVYPPISFQLIWDGAEIAWTYEGAEGWYPLRGAQFPGFAEHFKSIAPHSVGDLPPTFLAQGLLPGVVQIWSGYVARTAPGWALLSRCCANVPKKQPFENYEGIIETDTWFGPLFTNVRLTRTNSPVEFHVRYPLFQVQPLLRQCYREPSFDVIDAAEMTDCDWQRYEATIRPNTDQMRALGHYAVDTRRRLRREEAAK